MFSQICQYLKWSCDVCRSLASVLPSVASEPVSGYLLGTHGGLDDMLMQISLSLGTGRLLHGGKYILLTPACHEIIEPYSVPDCMLSWCSPNLFHSLIRGFERRKGTDWVVPGGMTSVSLLSGWCHMEFEWSDFSVSLCQLEDKATAKHHVALSAPGFGSNTGFVFHVNLSCL